MSTCPKCDNTSFKMVENSPSGSKFKVYFVECSKCGAVVGVMDFWNVGSTVKQAEKKLEEMDAKLK